MIPTIKQIQDSLDALNAKLSSTTPFAIQNVRGTQFSVARHFGAANYNGQTYTYNQAEDSLVRDDVIKWFKSEKMGAKGGGGGVE